MNKKGYAEITFTVIIVIICLIFFGFQKKEKKKIPEESKASLIFSGKHELKAMGNIDKTISSHSGGSFFFILGSYYSETKEIKTVSFAWKNGEEYIISTIPLDKVRIHIDNNVEIPYILFRWKADDYYYPRISKMIEEDVMYIVIFCKEEVWNPMLNIPLSKNNKE